MAVYLTPSQVADAMLAAGKWAWGAKVQDYTPLIELPGGIYLLCAGTGDAKDGFDRAQDLKSRLHRAIRRELGAFREEHGRPNPHMDQQVFTV